MKKSFLALVVVSAPLFCIAQWNISGNNIYNTNTGFVGIGTSSPTQLLDINGTARVQNLIPALDNTYNLGSFSIAYKNIYFKGALFLDAKKIFHNKGTTNLFVGQESGNAVTTGELNTTLGPYAFTANTTGSYNTAVGAYSLQYNTSGTENTALGQGTLTYNTTGGGNTAIGSFALSNNTTGYSNIAIGTGALLFNIGGDTNIAIGTALSTNSHGSENVAIGRSALEGNITGNYNTAVGVYTAGENLYGNYNTAIGHSSGAFDQYDMLNNTTALGYSAWVTASNQVRIGNTDVTSIGGQVSWSTLSDGRFKTDIKEDVPGLDFINQLKPVTYLIDKGAFNTFLGIANNSRSSNSKINPIRQTGFVAQDVEQIVKKSNYAFSGIDAPQNDKDPYRVRYAEFVMPLVKAVQELSAQLEAQKAIIDRQQQQINSLLSESNSDTQNIRNGEIKLFQNQPNPFSSTTQIDLRVPESTLQVHIIVYNFEGKQLKNITVKERGNVSVSINGGELSPGMYVYVLLADGILVDSKRMVLTN